MAANISDNLPETAQPDDVFRDSDITITRDRFLRDLLRELTGMLEDSVGLDESEGFISMVSDRLGTILDRDYRAAAKTDRLTPEQVAAALVDLKCRIEAGFQIESIDDQKIVLVNTHCPFAEHVAERPSLCMLMSGVFGRIAADNLGYARVDLEESIAKGDGACRIVLYFDEGSNGREYFG